MEEIIHTREQSLRLLQLHSLGRDQFCLTQADTFQCLKLVNVPTGTLCKYH